MDVNGCAGTLNEVQYLEHVQCKITLRFFPRGNLRILLTSPMGTVSTLLFERPRDVVKSNFDDWPFLSVHFWGEKAEGRWRLQIINGGRRRVNQPGILSKWQLIFYGTQTNPIRMRSEQNRYSHPSPTESEFTPPIQPINYNYNPDLYTYYPGVFSQAASNPEQAITTLDGHNIPIPQRENVMADSNNKIVLHDCDPECDQQGCYGRGPTQCVACKRYRLDKLVEIYSRINGILLNAFLLTRIVFMYLFYCCCCIFSTCVSRCPPRSFPNQGGVCWACHESCETCAGAGQDSCLTCAPAHLHVVDLAVCLQICPDGYYESKLNNFLSHYLEAYSQNVYLVYLFNNRS